MRPLVEIAFEVAKKEKLPVIVSTDAKLKKGDITYIKQSLPQTVFKVLEDVGHGGMAALKPELMVAELKRAMEE